MRDKSHNNDRNMCNAMAPLGTKLQVPKQMRLLPREVTRQSKLLSSLLRFLQNKLQHSIPSERFSILQKRLSRGSSLLSIREAPQVGPPSLSLSLSVLPALCASLFRVGHQIWQCVASRVTPSPFWAVNSVFAAAVSGSVFGQTKPSKVSLMWRFFALFLLLQFELKFTAYGG